MVLLALLCYALVTSVGLLVVWVDLGLCWICCGSFDVVFYNLFVVVYLDARCSGVINLVVGEFVVAFQSLIVLRIRYGICVCC